MELVNKNRFKLRNLLGTPKDKTPQLMSYGIYKVNCKASYIDQTRKSGETRFKKNEAQTSVESMGKIPEFGLTRIPDGIKPIFEITWLRNTLYSP